MLGALRNLGLLHTLSRLACTPNLACPGLALRRPGRCSAFLATLSYLRANVGSPGEFARLVGRLANFSPEPTHRLCFAVAITCAGYPLNNRELTLWPNMPIRAPPMST